MSSTTVTPIPTPDVRTATRRERVQAAILCLDSSVLYGEVFGLANIAGEYRSKAEQLLEVWA